MGGWSLTLQSLKALGGGFEGGGERGRGGYRVVKLMKQKKGGGEIRCLFLRRKMIFFYISDVMTWGKKRKKLCT